ncbi:hypothetical protein LB523_19240 [Mesorhizobium sp. ESP-6-4]|nr:hypothetical protein [Mesorhizobium sp. ESP-6-4]MBZ9661183.1 hypothetical protein [Mesorhizobium sp. ESP-6-4]
MVQMEAAQARGMSRAMRFRRLERGQATHLLADVTAVLGSIDIVLGHVDG